jgi:hypothetical protein
LRYSPARLDPAGVPAEIREAPAAHHYIQDRKNIGKVVLTA